MSDLNNLKELAGKATPGPWARASDWERAAVYSTSKDAHPEGKRVVCSGNQNNHGRYNAESWSGSDWNDAAFIAAANPVTVIGLIDQLESAQQRIAELKESFDELAEAVGWSAARCEQVGDSPLDCANELVSEMAKSKQRISELERDNQMILAGAEWMEHLTKGWVSLLKRTEAAEAELARREAEAEHEDEITIDALASMREWKLRAETAEAEIKRRDEAAGEPDYYIHRIEVCDSYGPDVELRAFNNALDASKCRDDHGGEVVELFITPPAPSAPDGWKLVPVEPTIAMTEAAIDEFNESRNMRDTYYALLEHAPAPVSIT